jgi:hypothetical protein
LTSDGGAIFEFKSDQACAEQLATGNDHNIKTWRNVISTKNLSDQTLSTISDDRAAEAFRGGDPEAPN